MAVTAPVKQRNDMLSHIEWLRRFDPNGNAADVAEALNENNEIIQDVAFKEGNLPTGDKQTIRTGLPAVYWRQLNRGVPTGKSQVASVTETCAELMARSQLDVAVARLNGLDAAIRSQEEKPFIESMSQAFAKTLFYGDASKTMEGFTGLATRYSTLNTSLAENAKNVIDCGGTGKKLTSIYIVGWGDNVYCPYPKGSSVGLKSEDLGKQLVDDDLGNKFLAYVSMYTWNVGLMVRDWRYVVRLANINPDDLFAGKGIGAGDLKAADSTNILLKLDLALSKLRRTGGTRYAMYMNSDVHSGLNVVAARCNMNVIKFSDSLNEYGDHSSWSSFKNIPLRQCDQIVNTETHVK